LLKLKFVDQIDVTKETDFRSISLKKLPYPLCDSKIDRNDNWCELNGMKINWSKSYFMFFYNKHSKGLPPDINNIVTTNFTITRANEFKYLDVWLDEKLDFSCHITKLFQKIKPRNLLPSST
jgi:hypothetical protein